MQSDLLEIERLIREAASVDQNRTRRIREMFFSILPSIGNASRTRGLIGSLVVAHTNFEIAQQCEPKLIEAKRQACLAALAQVEREIDCRQPN